MSAMATLNSVQDRVRGFLREKNSFTSVLATIESKTKVNREYIFYGKHISFPNTKPIVLDLGLEMDFNRLFYLFLQGSIGFLSFYLAFGWGSDFLCNLIGFLWPAYCSYLWFFESEEELENFLNPFFFSVLAIESASSDDDTKWLMYWSVYALFGILEYFSDLLLFWIPLYSLSKVSLILCKLRTLVTGSI
jgi:hypothetical protein